MHTSNLKVIIVEKDIYARYAIASYLGWDRRTRVTHKLASLQELDTELANLPDAELPDTVLLDGRLLPDVETVKAAFRMIQSYCDAHILVLAHQANPEIARALYDLGTFGYLLRDEVGLRVSWLVVWAQKFQFVTTPTTEAMVPASAVLPESRTYPELTDRIRQALMLCVVEGMSAELAADEMGLSPHTIRTYIKEGYSILEANDQTPLPANLSPQEKAFMRLTALELSALEQKLHDSEEKKS